MLCHTSFYSFLAIISFIFTDARIVPLQENENNHLAIDGLLDRNNLEMAMAPFDNYVLNQKAIFARDANKSICYPLVGCFDNNAPFDNAGLEIPQTPEFVNTAFLLFTQESPTEPELLSYDFDDDTLQKSSVNPTRWLRIVIHGFQNHRNTPWVYTLRDALLQLKNDELSDVLVIDWGDGAKFPLYTNAVANTRLVGKQVAVLLEKLQATKRISFDKVHCIGHSLGAHTCGYVSTEVGKTLARISGLDPAGPLFGGKTTDVRLDKDDAKFVDVIHSNTDVLFGIGLGISDESGDIDFYVNGGQSQPGCPSVTTLLGGVLNGQSEAAFEQSSCSHGRAIAYYTESINSDCPYTAFPCHDYNGFSNGKCLVCPNTGCAQMGFYSIYSLGRGKMFLATKPNSPFCGYHYFVEMVLDRDMVKTTGDIYVAIFSNYELLANLTVTPKANSDIKAGDIFRHVFSYHTDLGKVDYAVIYFNKLKSFLGFGSQNANLISISRLRLKSLEDTSVYSGICDSNLNIPAYASQTVLLNRFDCHD